MMRAIKRATCQLQYPNLALTISWVSECLFSHSDSKEWHFCKQYSLLHKMVSTANSCIAIMLPGGNNVLPLWWKLLLIANAPETCLCLVLSTATWLKALQVVHIQEKGILWLSAIVIWSSELVSSDFSVLTHIFIGKSINLPWFAVWMPWSIHSIAII